VSASPSEIWSGDRSTLSASFSDDCHGAIQAPSFSASEGTVSGNVYDSSSVQFDPSNNSEQRKTVTITATATGPGGTGTATTSIVVKKRANLGATRLPDIVFGRNNARVNNCGKRVLLEELKTYLDRDPAGKVVLVGHTDKGETKALHLDRKRALNAAAIVSAGQGICLNFAASQILIVEAGEDQGGVDFQPYFCGTSTNVKEKSGQAVSASDARAQYRRVEVWFVPANGVMPPSAANAKDAASMNVGSLGCPK